MVDINNKENETLESDFNTNSNLNEENKEKEKIQQLEESLRKGSIQFYSVTLDLSCFLPLFNPIMY